ncbi:Uncharacterized conserved protein, contains Zn-finger domain [Palleronia salina]|uniref:Uncharacterized conserved protein, contains Zn-finger domain n=2 Tax=Palleronia TaxID=315422 RepID=A0A1M6J6Q1_9RHOB|nr:MULTISPECIES: zinc-finger domain-containing protein [Palleronia]SEN94553.1 Uncharacterized conserved protein, contains Zn-finger domain [Palleronia pelagia]SHJ42340.1 Uncharacterized conserved protein, contains Zn-finger domain [Palleronia salina]
MSEKPVDLEGDLPPTGAFDAPETETVTTRRVSCDGEMTHPRVWLQIPEERGWVECGYCDKRFVLAEGADDH